MEVSIIPILGFVVLSVASSSLTAWWLSRRGVHVALVSIASLGAFFVPWLLIFLTLLALGLFRTLPTLDG